MRGSEGGKAWGKTQKRIALQKYYNNPNICKKCGEVIQVMEGQKVSQVRRKKFCGQSCNAKYSNARRVRVKKPKKVPKTRESVLGTLTKSELRELLCSWVSMRNAISRHAREVFKKKGICSICGYDKHADVCHVKAVADFDDATKIEQINDMGNLIELCPNHHWEFDHGELKL